MPCLQAQGAFTRLILESGEGGPYDFANNGVRFEQLNNTVGRRGRIVGNQGLTGWRTRRRDRTREGTPWFFGSLIMNTSPGELQTLLPFIQGSVTALTADVPYFGMLIDKEFGIFEIQKCKVNRARLYGRAPNLNEGGEPDLLQLQLDIIGTNEVVDSFTWPSPDVAHGTGTQFEPFMFYDLTATINGGTREVVDFLLEWNNYLEARYVNAQAPSSICPRDRMISAVLRAPWSADALANLYDLDPTGQAATLDLTHDGVGTVFTLPALQIPAEAPPIRGKTGLLVTLAGMARGVTGQDDELTSTNDITP